MTSKTRTRIVFGCSEHKHFVDRSAYDILKAFMYLPPTNIQEEKRIIQFEVPHCHISRGGQSDHHYFIQVDEHLQRVNTEAFRYYHNPLYLRYKDASKPSSLDRFSVHRERVLNHFLLKPDAEFSHVQYIDEKLCCQQEGWGYLWDTILQVQWICPYNSSFDKDKIVFRCKPKYSINVLVDGYPSLEIIKKFIEYGFPKYFSGTYLPFIVNEHEHEQISV